MADTQGKVVAVVLAGGVGKRMGGPVPKQFLELAGKPIIIHTLEKFAASPLITDIVVVCHKDHIQKLEDLTKEYSVGKIYKIVAGGAVRQESSYIGVKNCPEGTEIVLIHDAVRPFIDNDLIKSIVEASRETGAAGPVVETGDTIVVHEGGFIKSIPDRATLGRIQTPQGFKFEEIIAAHKETLARGITDCTDDCGLILSCGGKVATVEGSLKNIKITSREDLVTANNLQE